MIEENVVAAAGTQFSHHRGRNPPRDRRGGLRPPAAECVLRAGRRVPTERRRTGTRRLQIVVLRFRAAYGRLRAGRTAAVRTRASASRRSLPTRHDPRPRTDQALRRPAARAVRGAGRDQLPRPAGADLRPAGAQRGGQDHGPADPQHGAAAHRRHGHDQRLRRAHAARPGPPPDRLHVGQHGRLRPHDRLGDGRILRPAARHPAGRARPSGWRRSSTG